MNLEYSYWNKKLYQIVVATCTLYLKFSFGFKFWIEIFVTLLYIRLANGPGDPGTIPGRVIRKTLKMVLNTYLLKTQHYKVRIKGKVEQSKERSSYWKGSLRVLSTTVINFTYLYIYCVCVMKYRLHLANNRLLIKKSFKIFAITCILHLETSYIENTEIFVTPNIAFWVSYIKNCK